MRTELWTLKCQGVVCKDSVRLLRLRLCCSFELLAITAWYNAVQHSLCYDRSWICNAYDDDMTKEYTL